MEEYTVIEGLQFRPLPDNAEVYISLTGKEYKILSRLVERGVKFEITRAEKRKREGRRASGKTEFAQLLDVDAYLRNPVN